MKKMLIAVALFTAFLVGCAQPADVASRNLSLAADYFLVIEGTCSLGNYDAVGELSVTCQTGPNAFKKHFLGLSDNVTYFAEQIESADTDLYHYRVIFRPSTIIPDAEVDLP